TEHPLSPLPRAVQANQEMILMPKKTRKKSWMKMTASELAKATREFDREVDLTHTRPLSSENRKWWNRARRAGRPKVGKGAQPILITMEKGLLEQADAYAKKHHINRSQLVAMGIQSLIRKRAG